MTSASLTTTDRFAAAVNAARNGVPPKPAETLAPTIAIRSVGRATRLGGGAVAERQAIRVNRPTSHHLRRANTPNPSFLHFMDSQFQRFT